MNFEKEIKIENYTITKSKGVTRFVKKGVDEEIICKTPLVVSGVLIDSESQDVSMELSWLPKKSNKIQTEVFDKRTLLTRSGLKELYNTTIDINGANAGKLAQFFSDMYNNSQDEDIIPLKYTTRTLGWQECEGELNFVPYSSDLILNKNDNAYKDIFNSIKISGDEDRWIRGIKKLHNGSCTPAKIAIASSFASVMMQFFGVDPFIVNFYGKTGIGKTLLLNIAASLWGSKKLIQNNNASATALEAKLKFLNSFPFLLDEIKGSDTTNKDLNSFAYTFSGGIGKSRGSVTGGLLSHTEGWKNIMISSGESPYLETGASSGVVNRVIDVYCGETPLFTNPRETYEFFQNNYGFLMKYFKEWEKKGFEKIFDGCDVKFKEIYDYYCSLGISEKQASLGAVLIVSDYILCSKVFEDTTIEFSKEELLPHLRSEKSIDVFKETLSSLMDYFESNSQNLISSENHSPKGSLIGYIQGGIIYGIPLVVDKFIKEKNVEPKQFNRYLKSKGLIEVDKEGNATVPKTLGDKKAKRYYCYKINEINEFLND